MERITKERTSGRVLKEPYVKVRHFDLFKRDKESAEKSVWLLNYAIYHPIGLTVEEIKTLISDDRAKYYIEKVSDDRYEILERFGV